MFYHSYWTIFSEREKSLTGQMIHLITKGGLGNQMFEYAFALQMQQAFGEQGICVNDLYHRYGPDKRKSALHHFRLSENTKLLSPLKSTLYLFSLIATIARTCGFRNLLHILRRKLSTTTEEQSLLRKAGAYCTTGIFSYPDIIPSIARIKHAYGNFQDKKVINGIEDLLRSHFTVKTPPSGENKKQVQQIQQDNAVCVHIRRGDYLLPQYKQLQVCDEAYYREAMKQARKTLKNPVFYVFSTGHEDLEWVRQNYNLGENVHYVDLDNPDYEELRLMMHCKHFIISNSTFSWWAAVLSNAAPDKQVWCPATWLRGSDISMALDSWNLI